MNEIDALERLRDGVPPMTARARLRGRSRLLDEIDGRRSRSRRLPARRLLILGGALVAMTVVLLGYQVVGRPETGSTAEAATVLDRAAIAAGAAPARPPRNDQFIYVETVHVAGSDRQRVEQWVSVDGSRPGLIRSSGSFRNGDEQTPGYDPASGLGTAPYTVLAGLPTDPDELLRVLSADPAVRGDAQRNGVSPQVAIWGLMRGLVVMAPPPQKTALLRAAARIEGITYVAEAADAAGRTGEAVGLDDPRIGNVQFIFDPVTHAFLGERILQRGDAKVAFNDAIQRTGVADEPGIAPHS